jgi:hypothetical protein
MEQEEQVVVRFLVPKSWVRRTYALDSSGYGIMSDIGRTGYLKELQERERQQMRQTQEQEAKAS